MRIVVTTTAAVADRCRGGDGARPATASGEYTTFTMQRGEATTVRMLLLSIEGNMIECRWRWRRG